MQKNITIGLAISIIVLVVIVATLTSYRQPAAPSTGLSQPTSTNVTAGPCDGFDVSLATSSVEYKELTKDADLYIGRRVMYKGQVAQILELPDGSGMMRLAVAKTSYGWDPSDIIYVNYLNHTDAVDGDVVKVYGILAGSKSYTSQANFVITVPSMTGCVVDSGKSDTPVISTNNTAVSNKTNSSNNQIVDKKTNLITSGTTTVVSPQPQIITNPLLVSCSPSISNVGVGGFVTWTAQVSGGGGNYTYFWSDSDHTTGNAASLLASYSTTGIKTASVKVTSGINTIQTVTQQCSGSVSVYNPTPQVQQPSPSWHTAMTYSNNTSIKTTPFSMQGNQWRITYSCSATDPINDFYGYVFSTNSDVYSENFASAVTCPQNNTSYAYNKNPGQYYLDLRSFNVNYTVTVEDYY